MITGTVTDSEGALVSNAQVVIKNLAASLTYNAQTPQDGTYSAPLLPIGSYDLTVCAKGFKIHHQASVGKHICIDIRLL